MAKTFSRKLFFTFWLLNSLLAAQTVELALALGDGSIRHLQDRGGLLLRPFPAASLLKLFLTYLYLAKGGNERRVIFCHPSSPQTPLSLGCWFRPGHRNQNLVQAMANSCDHYFLSVAAEVSLNEFATFLERLNLTPTRIWMAGYGDGQAETMVGLNPQWRFDLRRLLAATATLLTDRLFAADNGNGLRLTPIGRAGLDAGIMAVVKRGMRESALYGTSQPFQQDVPFPVMGKTGTFAQVYPRMDIHRVSGIFIGFFPFPDPQYGVLVFSTDGNGRDQAARAAVLVRELLRQRRIALRR